MENLVAFIGFGEAAFHIANGLKSEGLMNIVAYDINQNDVNKGAVIRKRAEEAGITLADSLEDAYTSARVIASLTSAKVALEIAEAIIPHLVCGQNFVDMNSTAPTVKSDIGRIPRTEGVLVCDAAVMNTVPGNGHKVQIFLSGDGAKDFYESLSKYGMNLKDLDAPIGGSSAIKMFRSVFMKGLPQLMFESMLPAARYGVLSTLLESLNETIKDKTMEQLADNLIVRTLIHAERRASEMKDVIATLEGMGIDASMSRSTEKKLQQLAKLNMVERVGAAPNINYEEAINLLIAEN